MYAFMLIKQGDWMGLQSRKLAKYVSVNSASWLNRLEYTENLLIGSIGKLIGQEWRGLWG